MNKIVGIYQDKQQVDRVLEALDEMGFDKEALSTFSRSRVEVEEAEGEAAQELLVVAYVKEDRQDQVLTIFNNSGATEVNVWDDHWEPETTWSPIVYGSMFHP
jgi:hypothetical protein